MTEQRFIFDQVAELYDAQRPGYPEALFDALLGDLDCAGEPRVLEIGCGSGQATRALLEHGCHVVGLEPGKRLGALAHAKLAASGAFEWLNLTFEDWPLEEGAFDGVVSAQAFHWLDPETAFPKCADALRPGRGVLAVVGNETLVEDSPLLDELHAEVYAVHAPELLGGPPTSWYGDQGPIESLFEGSDRFESVAHRRTPWERRYSSAEYVGLMATQSDHRLLPGPRRDALHRGLARHIDARGGAIVIRYVAHLYSARVRSF